MTDHRTSEDVMLDREFFTKVAAYAMQEGCDAPRAIELAEFITSHTTFIHNAVGLYLNEAHKLRFSREKLRRQMVEAGRTGSKR